MPSDKRALTGRAWLIEMISITICGLILAVAINMSIDIYGIFRNAKDRQLFVYGDERVAKYLLSEKYVPENFNALLIGTSVSGNWNTDGFDRLRVYNESLDGGNSVEERAIAEQALAGSHVRVAILVVHPYLTASHQFETEDLTPRENLEALGSQSLLTAYKSVIRIKLHLDKQAFYPNGTHDFGDIPPKMNAHLQKLMTPGVDFPVDQTAMKSYKALVAELHAANVPIIYVVPPIAQNIYAAKAGPFATYSRIAMATKLPQDHVIDFTSDQYIDFRRDSANFQDGVHLTREGAMNAVALISHQIDEWIQDGELPAPQAANAAGKS